VWYRERPEPEEVIVGVVRAHETGASPMGRTRLLFELDQDEGAPLPIYGPHAEATLAEVVGRRVSVRGRVVDMTGEGSGPELWVAMVDATVESIDLER
jgi:hypothetical protein